MNLRLSFEQKLLPSIVFSGKEHLMGFIRGALIKRGAWFGMILQDVYDSEKIKCPYDLDKISVDNQIVSAGDGIPDFGILIVDMPEPDEERMASRIFICFTQSFDVPFYLLAEKSASDSYEICNINETGKHYKLIGASENRLEQLHKVAKLYAQYWAIKTNANYQVVNQSRYYIEQTYLPHVLFKNERLGKSFLTGLMEDGGKMMHTLFDSIYKTRDEDCPYSADQFSVKTEEVAVKDTVAKFCVVTVDLPKPEEMLLCSRIFICFGPSFEKLRYFLVERSFDSEFALCHRDGEGAHLNYGKAPELEIEQFKKVCGIYEDYLKSSADK